MNAFDKARAKYEKNRERQNRAPLSAQDATEVVEVAPIKKAEPPKQKEQVIKIALSGPVDMELEIHYGGTLLGSQVNEATLRGLLVKQLSVLGRVV